MYMRIHICIYIYIRIFDCHTFMHMLTVNRYQQVLTGIKISLCQIRAKKQIKVKLNMEKGLINM